MSVGKHNDRVNSETRYSTSNIFSKLRKDTILLSSTFSQHQKTPHTKVSVELMRCKAFRLHFKSKENM